MNIAMMTEKRFFNRVKHYMEQYHMLHSGDRVVAGISGGADSVCLFFVLLELQQELGITFHGVHVNHGLRGEAADSDEQFVVRLCEKYQVPLDIYRVDLNQVAKDRKVSLEEAGRDIRREAFLETMGKWDGTKIALAHHQNDNAETLLWNLARGTGLRGMAGIRPVHGIWIRPLLGVTRQDIESCLQYMGQDFCTDLTNLETTYTRNKIRHQVLPVLEEEVNPAAVRHMNEAMEQMGLLRDFVEEETIHAVERVCRKTECFVELLEEEWRKLPKFLQKEVIYTVLEEVSGSGKDLGKVHIQAVEDLFDQQVGRWRMLPGAIRALCTYDGVRVEQYVSEEKEFPKKESCVELIIPGMTEIPGKNLRISCQIIDVQEPLEVAEIPQKRYTKWLDYDIIASCLKVRGRELGDWLVIDKAGHEKKLKSWFVNEKIPADQRGEIPLIADGNQIVWIVGYRMNMAYQVSANTKRILEIKIQNMLEDERDGRNN